MMVQMGRGMKKDSLRALSLHQRGCQAGVVPACNNLAGLYYEGGTGVPVDLGRAAALYDGACQAGDSLSCDTLGEMTRDGKGVKREPGRAAGLFMRACDPPPLAELAPDRLENSVLTLTHCALEDGHSVCRNGYPRACVKAGVLWAAGDGLEKDGARAMAAFQKGCDDDEGEGCLDLAILYSQGQLVPQDSGRSRHFAELACARKVQMACDALAAQPLPGTPPPADAPQR